MRSLILTWLILTAAGPVAAFDHDHAIWNTLLSLHVALVSGGNASRVDYAGLLRDRKLLDTYTAQLSAIALSEFESWGKPDQEAFLINAYNAFTVELILTRYPNLQSIKDLGGWLSSPWKRKFFVLLGADSDLDGIESRLRAAGVYDDPRIHVAINCASVGCPMLRNEAYVAGRLDMQLNDALRRFLSDRSRNRYDSESGSLEVSKIFDWYREDFSAGHHGMISIAHLFSDNADLLASDPGDRVRIRAAGVPIAFLPYDWSLNDVRH